MKFGHANYLSDFKVSLFWDFATILSDFVAAVAHAPEISQWLLH